LIAVLFSINAAAGLVYAQNSPSLPGIDNGSFPMTVNDVTDGFYTFASNTGGSYSILIDLATIEDDSI